MKNKISGLAVLSILLAGSAHGASLMEKSTTHADQRSVSVTIYNENLALVKDTRRVDLDKGGNRLAWRDVSARIMPETALLREEGDTSLSVLEQNFDFDLLTPQKLLEKHVGQKVIIIKTHPQTGVESREAATVLSTNNGVVLGYADRIETGVPGRIAFDTLPGNLRDRPTLLLSLDSSAAGSRALELSYLTGGLSWRADYVAELNAKDDRLDISGWVTLTNTSGTSYADARLQLVAGDVNRVRQELPRSSSPAMANRVMSEAAPMAEESLFEYHLYTLDRPTTIAEQQTKQVALLSASHIPVRKELLLQGRDYYYRSSVGDLGQKMKVGVFVEFDNRGQGLGVPLPKGVIRVYKKDSGGRAQFVGEDRIDHTPRNEKIRIKLGDAFDVTADKKQTDFQKISGSHSAYVFESAYQIDLKNAKDEAVTVKLLEPVPGDWQIVSESHAHKKLASNTAVWEVVVPANGKASVNYRVRVKF